MKRGIRTWNATEDDYLIRNAHINRYEILKIGLPNRTKKSVLERRRALGLVSKHPAKWTDEENNILKQIYKSSTEEILIKAIPNHSILSIYRQASSLGLKHESFRKYEINHTYFEKPNLENSYWAGFIAADGHLFARDNGMRIALARADRSQLEKFRQCIGFTGPIKDTEQSNYWDNSKVCYGSSIEIYSRQMQNDLLRNFTIHKGDKTDNLLPPKNLSDENILAFIKGYFDGDGSVSWNHHKNRNKPGVTGYKCFEASGTLAMVTWIKENIYRLIPFTENHRPNAKHIYKIKGTWLTAINGRHAKIIFERLKSINTPELDRKWVIDWTLHNV